MKQQIKKILSILIPIFLGIFFIVLAYNKFTPEQLDEISNNLKGADYFYICLSILFGFLGSFARAYRWRYTLEHLGYNIPFKNQFLAVNISYLMNMFIPRSGEISRALVLRNYNNVPFDKSFGTIVAERVIDLILLFIFIVLVFFLQFDIVKTFILDNIPKEKIILLLLIGITGFIALIVLFKFVNLKIINSIKEKLSGLKDGMLSVVQMKNKSAFLFYTFLIWISYILMFYASTFAFTETSNISFIAVLTTFIVGSIAIAFTNNGLGSYPFLVSEILLFYGVSITIGSAFGWIAWISQTIFTLIIGLISIFVLPILNKK